jgi:hypothetical protein
MTKSSPERKQRRSLGHCHWQIADTAKAMAGELYETVMANNQVREQWVKSNPDCNAKELERRFVAKNWHKCVAAARSTLAAMLTGPYDEALKEQIHTALVLDQSLRFGKGQRRAPVGATIN